MWSAQFVSNVGSWMQTVGAQWLMLSLTSSAAFLGLIQTAATLPVLVFSVPAGVVGDLVHDQRAGRRPESGSFRPAMGSEPTDPPDLPDR